MFSYLSVYLLQDIKLFLVFSELSSAKNIYNMLCGFNNKPLPKLTPEEKAAQRAKMTNITENATVSKLCDINAVIAIAVTCFIIGFYA